MSEKANVAPAEMEILRYVMDHQPVTVREVADYLAETKGQTRTTALNVMERLRAKGYLARQKSSGIYEYSAAEPRKELLSALVRNFVDRTLGGSISPFAAYLAQDARLSPRELDDLKRVVNELEPRREDGDA